MSRYPPFDRRSIALKNLGDRGHLLAASDCPAPGEIDPTFQHPDLPKLARAILTARENDRPVIAFIGGHVIKQGMSRFLIDLIERRVITHLATNGAGIIHDFELALAGGTSEDVARYIRSGEFGLWGETGRLNDIIREARDRGEGIGEAVGRTIEQQSFPFRGVSVCAAGYRYGVPVTIHVTIGADIIHQHPNCDGGAWGEASYTDFLIFAESVRNLAGGVFLNIGSAVTGPEVYLKALSMSRNVAREHGESISDFTTAVFDLVPLPADWRNGTRPKDDPFYYFRPWKTILVRTVADGGRSVYICGDHRDTIPALWRDVSRHVGGK